MSQIGAINVKISADDTEFNAAVKRVKKELGETGKELRAAANQFGKWGAAAAAAGAAASAAIFKATAQSVRELNTLAQVSNTSVAELQRLAFASNTVGVEQDKLADILKDVNDRVGDFNATGGGPMLDFFEQIAPKVGVTAEQFRNLSGPQALQLYVSSLEKANLSQADMTFFMEAMASDSTRLLPLLRDNGAALQELARQAEEVGVGLSAIDVEHINRASAALDKVTSALSSQTQAAVAEFAPLVEIIANDVLALTKETGDFGVSAISVFEGVATVAGVFADGLRGIQVVAKGIETGLRSMGVAFTAIITAQVKAIEGFVNLAISGINRIVEAANSLGANLPTLDSWSSSVVSNMEGALQSMMTAQQTAVAELHALMMQPMPSDGIDAYVEQVKQRMAEVAETVRAATSGQDPNNDSSTSLGLTKAEQEQLNARIEAIRQAGLTEQQVLQEKYAADHEALRLALENELLTREEYAQRTLEVAQRYSDQMTQVEAESAAQRQRLQEMEARTKLGAIQDSLGQMSSLMNSESRKLFEIGKTAAIANSLINAYEAVTSAYRYGSSIGGPPVGALMAAAAGAAQFAQIKQIKAQSFSRGAGGGANQFSGGVPAVNTTQQQPSRNINISLTGSSFGAGGIRDLIAEINGAIGDGVALNVIGG